MREYEFSQSQAEQVRVVYKYTFALFALLLLVHMGFIGSAVPYVYSEQETSVCGARKVISFLFHRVTVLGLIFSVASVLLLSLAVLQAVNLETRVRLIVSVLLIAMTSMLFISYAEIAWASKLPRLPQDLHNCAYPANASAW